MATAESAKTCVVCGKDVAGKPRVKDAAGHYMCAGECQQKAIAAAKSRQAPPAKPQGVIAQAKAPVDDGGILGSLIADSPMLKSAKCDSCGSAMPGEAVICTRCGFNTQTGKALKTAVIVEKEKKEPKSKGKGGNPYATSSGPNGWVIFGCVTGVLCLLALMPLVSVEMVIPAALAIGLSGLIGWLMLAYEVYNEGSTGVVAVFIAMRVGSRFAWMIPFPLNLLTLGACELGMLAYVLFFVESRWARSFYVGAIIAGFVLGVTTFISGSHELEKMLNP